MYCCIADTAELVVTQGRTYDDNSNTNNKLAYASQLNRFTHIKSLLVLHDRGI
jgi:hypothetical protein